MGDDHCSSGDNVCRNKLRQQPCLGVMGVDMGHLAYINYHEHARAVLTINRKLLCSVSLKNVRNLLNTVRPIT